MKTHITTIFDKNYIVRALAFRQSLYKYAPNASVYLLCLDDESYEILKKINLSETDLIKIENLNDKELNNSKNNRTMPEFASTAKPALLRYMLNSGKVAESDLLAFIDPDILFYSSPKKLFEKIYNSGSITITPHRFPKNRDSEKYQKGFYNAGMVFFKNNEISKKCIEEWRKQCIEWCFIRYEDGKIGDQGYLSNWPEKYKDVFILEDKGVNLATWNIENYNIKKIDENFFIDDEILVCYHFHGLKIFIGKSGEIKSLPITAPHKRIYKKYITELDKVYKKVLNIQPKWNLGFIPHPGILRILKQNLFRTFIFLKK